MSAPSPLVFLYLTRRCSERCLHCYLSCQPTYSEQELNTDQVFTLIRELAESGVDRLNLDGGDVFLRPDLEEIVLFAALLGLKVSLVASAHLVDLSRLLKMGDALYAVSLSIDGASASTHDWLRCRDGSFNSTIQLLGNLLPIFRVRLWCTVHARNYLETPKLVNIVGSLGPPELLSFFSVSPLGRASDNWTSLAMDQREIGIHLECVRQLSEEYPWVCFEVNSLPLDTYDAVRSQLQPCNRYRRNCAYISPSGGLFSCSLLLALDGKPEADLTQRHFNEVWTDQGLWQNDVLKCKHPSICHLWPESLSAGVWTPVCSQTFYGRFRQIHFRIQT